MGKRSNLDIVIEFLQKPRTVGVIGASTKPHRAGHFVPKFLKSKGFEIIPINPNYTEVLGKNTLDSLADLSEREIDVDGVLIYRNEKFAEQFALDAISMRIPMIWLPDNVFSSKAEILAKEKGLHFVQDRCPLRDYRKFINK